MCFAFRGAHFPLAAANSKPRWVPGLVLGAFCLRGLLGWWQPSQASTEQDAFGGLCAPFASPEDF